MIATEIYEYQVKDDQRVLKIPNQPVHLTELCRFVRWICWAGVFQHLNIYFIENVALLSFLLIMSKQNSSLRWFHFKLSGWLISFRLSHYDFHFMSPENKPKIRSAWFFLPFSQKVALSLIIHLNLIYFVLSFML